MMAMGPGKYDAECTKVRESTGAAGVILIVFGGEHGNGFSAQTDISVLLTLPDILRNIADRIERSTGNQVDGEWPNKPS